MAAAALGCVAIALTCSYSAPARAADEPFFMRQTGGFYHYVRESSTTFASIKSKIESNYYSARGVRNLIIYCPYRASEEYRGVPAVDFFSTNPNTGSVEDFRAMAVAAHAKGMGVVAYMGLLFVDPENAIWLKAQQDHKAGVASPEANTFLWAANPSDEVQDYGGWEHSDVADSYYATSWGRPAIHLGHADGRAYVKSVIAFWLTLGVDGFEYDSLESFWGQTPSILKDVLVTYPNSYTPGQKYLMREGPLASFGNAEESDTIGLTHVLLSGDTDDRSVATDVVSGEMTVDQLEAHFATYLDARRAAGRGAKAVSNYSDMTAGERAFEAAVLAGNGAAMEIDYDAIYALLDQNTQKQYDAVFAALARTTAEAPGASRKRVPTGANKLTYGVVRVSTDGTARALNLYNFAKQPSMLQVDLSGTGIAPGDVPLDLVTNTPGAAVTATAYSVSLPALGYALLGFGELSGGGGTASVPLDTAGSGGSSSGAQGGRSQTSGGTSSGGGATTGGKPSSNTGGSDLGSNGGDSAVAAARSEDSGCGCSTVPRPGGLLAAVAVAVALAASIKRRVSR